MSNHKAVTLLLTVFLTPLGNFSQPMRKNGRPTDVKVCE